MDQNTHPEHVIHIFNGPINIEGANFGIQIGGHAPEVNFGIVIDSDDERESPRPKVTEARQIERPHEMNPRCPPGAPESDPELEQRIREAREQQARKRELDAQEQKLERARIARLVEAGRREVGRGRSGRGGHSRGR